MEAAKAKGLNAHQHLTELAAKQKVGEHGLVALDWWNGNRSVLVDVDLTGMMLGMTLQTKPEDMYRALVEATAYGTRMIIENYREHGVAVEAFLAARWHQPQNICDGLADAEHEIRSPEARRPRPLAGIFGRWPRQGCGLAL